ncbi:MAG: hypothetical protein WDO13_01025 [Verrucomicrobiota bacterium]
MATVIFLLYVFGALVGNDRLPSMLGILLFVGAAAWIYGRWGEPVMPLGWRVAGIALCLLILAGALLATIGLAREDRSAGQAAATAEGWQPVVAGRRRRRAGPGQAGLRRLHRGVVPELQGQRGGGARQPGGEGRLRAEGRGAFPPPTDPFRSADHGHAGAVQPRRRAALPALLAEGEGRTAGAPRGPHAGIVLRALDKI